MSKAQATSKEPTPPKKRGRPPLKPGEVGKYRKGRRSAKSGAPPKLLGTPYQISVLIETDHAIMLIADFGSITEGIRTLILAHLEQATQPAPEARSVADSVS